MENVPSFRRWGAHADVNRSRCMFRARLAYGRHAMRPAYVHRLVPGNCVYKHVRPGLKNSNVSLE